MGRGGPLPSDYWFGGASQALPAGSGAEPRPKMDFMHILDQKEAIWNTIFSIFERCRGPPNVAGPGETFPPYPPLDGPAWDMVFNSTLDPSYIGENFLIRFFSNTVMSCMFVLTAKIVSQ